MHSRDTAKIRGSNITERTEDQNKEEDGDRRKEGGENHKVNGEVTVTAAVFSHNVAGDRHGAGKKSEDNAERSAGKTKLYCEEDYHGRSSDQSHKKGDSCVFERVPHVFKVEFAAENDQ